MDWIDEILLKRKLAVIEDEINAIESVRDGIPVPVKKYLAPKFNIYKPRDYYDCFLPDDVVLNILNIVAKVSSSLVCYQFYTVNRNFVSKCYHIHHFIPKIQSIINKNDLSPNIIVINFKSSLYNQQFDLYRFNNINNETITPIFFTDTINLLEFITHLTHNDPYVRTEFFSSLEVNFNMDDLYNKMIIQKFLRSINEDIISHMVDLLFLFKQNIINNTADLTLLCDTLINCMPDKDMTLQILNQLSYKIKNVPFYVLLFKIVTDSEALNNIYKFILNMSSRKEYYDYILNIKYYIISMFIVDQNSLFLMSHYKKPIIQFYTSSAPEHQWFANQLKLV